MNYLKDFIPEEFDKKSKREKMISIRNLSKEIFHHLNLSEIPIVFDAKSKSNDLSGKFITNPASIYINDFFLDDEAAHEALSNLINHYSFLPYYLVHTISHECFHYYQFCLINKLTNGELEGEDKDMAYLYFISLYSRLFYSFCQSQALELSYDIDEDVLYHYSFVESKSDEFAQKITELLSKKEEHTTSFNYFKSIMRFVESSYPKIEGKSFNEIQVDVLRQNLDAAYTFLKHKNATSGVKAKYLNIDEEELKASVEHTIKDMEQTNIGLKHLLNKINKK